MDSESATIEVIRSIQLAIIVPINLIGNTLVCIVLYRTPQLRTPMNYLLVNLAISDMMVALFMTMDQPFFYGLKHPPGITGDYLCKFITGKLFSWVGSVASCFTLVALVFERYYAIVYPLRSRAHITRKQFHVIIIICWTFAFCFNIPLIVVRIYNTKVIETGYFCKSNWSSTDYAKAYNILWLVFIGILPIALMGFLYGRIAQSLWCTENRVGVELTSHVRFKTRKRVTKMLITITIIYALCWMPNLLINVISYYHTPPGIFSYGYLITEVLVLLNSSINPFVYSIQSQQFRNGVKEILCCTWYRIRGHRVPQSNQGTSLQLPNIRSPRVSMVTGGFAT